jgi:RHS repeat-associated protein
MILDTNFNGVIITDQYDTMNRLTNQFSINGYQVSYTYTRTGQRSSMTDPSGLTTYTYDNRDRVRTNATPEGTLFYGYDANGNDTDISSSTPGGTSVTYQYDALNRLTNAVDARLSGTQNTACRFDAVGNLQSYAYPNGVTNHYQYDSLNRVTNVIWKLNATSLASFGYTLGATGNRTALSETLTNISRGYAWNYDALYRLTNETVSVSAPTGTLGYGYDNVGNRTNRTGSIGTLGTQTLAYTTNDWLTTDSYDDNGNTTNSGAGSQPYQYDVQNHLTNFNSGQVILVYDGDGNRVRKITSTTTTLYLVDTLNPSGYAQVLEELSVSGTTNLSKAYTYGLDLISQRQPGVSTNYFIYDGHGSTRILAGAGKNVVNVFAYDAYGNLIASNSAPQTAYLYCGQQFDSNFGLYYNRARYLNPNTGRFWTSDTTEGDNEDPLSLHKYLYGSDNPVNRIDPSGHDDGLDSIGFDINIASIYGLLATTLGTAVTSEPGFASLAFSPSITVKFSVDTHGEPSGFNASDVQSKLQTELSANVFDHPPAGHSVNINVHEDAVGPGTLGWIGSPNNTYVNRVTWDLHGIPASRDYHGWPNRDPIQETGGLNLYRYANNNPINAIDTDGLAVYVYYHPAFFPADPFNHSAIVLQPDNPSQFANNPLFSATDGQQATLGGQPGGPGGQFLDPFGNLQSKPNYPGDNPANGKCPNNLVPVQPPPGMSDSQFINSLINAADSYGNDEPYDLTPADGGGYNSNGYVSGVIDATGATAPNLPVWVPGYSQPLPVPYSPPLPLPKK